MTCWAIRFSGPSNRPSVGLYIHCGRVNSLENSVKILFLNIIQENVLKGREEGWLLEKCRNSRAVAAD